MDKGGAPRVGSPSITAAPFGGSSASSGDSGVASDAGATANLARFKRLTESNSLLA